MNCVGNVKFCGFCKNLLDVLLTKRVTSRLERFVSRILIRRFAGFSTVLRLPNWRFSFLPQFVSSSFSSSLAFRFLYLAMAVCRS